jgi:hypothetical protein
MDFKDMASILIDLSSSPTRTNWDYDGQKDEISILGEFLLITSSGQFLELTPHGHQIVDGYKSDLTEIACYLYKRYIDRHGYDTRLADPCPAISQQIDQSTTNIDQSTNINGDISGAVFPHSTLNNSPIIVNSTVTGQIEKIVQTLQGDSSLSAEELNDALLDIESLKNQLQRSNPDRSLLDRILTHLGDIASIGSFVAVLSGMLLP